MHGLSIARCLLGSVQFEKIGIMLCEERVIKFHLHNKGNFEILL